MLGLWTKGLGKVSRGRSLPVQMAAARFANTYPPKKPGFCPERKETRAYGRFKGKVAVVTGAAGNFGTACAQRFADEGASVALVDLKWKDDSLAKELSAKHPGAKFQTYSVDIGDAAKVNETTAAIAGAFGRVDYLFNNAGYQGLFKPVHEYDEKDFDLVTRININGSFHVLKAVANVMKGQKEGGVIVQSASEAGHAAPCNMPAYAASKAAVAHLTKVSAVDLAPHNIRVCSVSPAFIGPGFMWARQVELQAEVGSIYYDKDPNVVAEQMINTPCMKRYGSVDEVIGPTMFLFSDDASYLTGIDIQITGGIL